MSKAIKMKLTESSIKKAIEELEQYQKSLEKKNKLFVKLLADGGLDVARTILLSSGEGDSGRNADFTVETTSTGEIVSAQLKVSSTDILFWEFGAGIKYNRYGGNPKAGQLGYGVGTYPNQTHAYNEKGWWYTDKNGESRHSYGTEATMPMYKASMAIYQNIRMAARQIFGGSI